MHHQQPVRLQVPSDAVQARDLFLRRVEVLEGVPGDDHQAERLAQETRKTLEAEKALAEKQRELVNEEQNILIAQR